MASRRKILSWIGVSIVLFIMPIISIYFMNKGINDYKIRSGELKHYGTYPNIQVEANNNAIIDTAFLSSKVSFHAFVNTDKQDLYKTALNTVYEQFEDHPSKNVVFISYAVGMDSLAIHDYKKGKDKNIWFVAPLEEMVADEIASSIAIPDSLKNVNLIEGNYAAFVDSTLMVRRSYDLTDSVEIGKMVIHTALLFERPPNSEIKIRPKKNIEY